MRNPSSATSPPEGDAAAPQPPVRRRHLAGILVLATLLRLLYAGLAHPVQETPGLSRKYQACAEHVLEGDGFVLQVQPLVPYCDRIPGYVVLLAGLLLLSGGTGTALVALHAAVGALQALLASLLGQRAFGAPTGLLAGLLVAAWPPLWKSDEQLVETGAAGCAVAALALAVLASRAQPSWRTSWSLAAVGTLAVALRPDYLLLPVVAALLLVALPPRASLRFALPVLLLPLALIVPWAARNARVADGPFIGVGLGVNLLAALGEEMPSETPLFGDQDVARSEGHDSLFWPNPAARDRARVHRALGLIAAHPGAYLRGAVRRVAVTLSLYPGRLWPFGSTPEESLREWRAAHAGGRYAGMTGAAWSWMRAEPATALATLAWGPLLLLGVACGTWRLLRAGPQRRRRLVTLAVVLALPAYGLAVHLPLHAEPRYFFPFVPCLCVVAAAALAWRAPDGRVAA